MSGFLGVLFMSVLLAAASFGIGVLPLSFTFSKPALAKVSALGTGLLLGAALGVIIPEGIETLVESPSAPGASKFGHAELPTTMIALSLLGGFTFMLLVEQLLSPHSHSSPALPASQPHTRKSSLTDGPSTVEFDAELELSQLERAEGTAFDSADPSSNANPRAQRHRRRGSLSGNTAAEGRARAVPLTLGLVMHALADGLALGSSALSSAGENTVGAGSESSTPMFPSSLSIVVFFALVIHKAPTALALTTSLLSTPLSHVDCKRHIAAFSLSTPLGALASYVLLSWFELGATNAGAERVPGVAMLVSGGTFLYVATVLRPLSGHGPAEDADIGRKMGTFFTLLGMFVPVAIGALVGHDHGRGA